MSGIIQLDSIYGACLGEIIDILGKYPPGQLCKYGFGRAHSYRGYYDDLAFSLEKDVTVGEMLERCKECLYQTFEGYKGGEFTMHERTRVWIAEYGEADGQLVGKILLAYMLDDL